MNGKPKVAIVYGGKSAEYEVSLQTAFSVINAIDKEKYEVLPVHITNKGRWVEGHVIAGALEYKEQLLLDENPTAVSANEWLTPSNINASKHKPDIVFPLLHGPNGEDGTVQGLFELLDIAYVGSGVAGSAVAMDKVLAKDIFRAHGIPQAAYLAFTKYEWTEQREHILAELEGLIGYPCFVKPANLGSSIGISKSHDRKGFMGSVELAFQFDQKVVVEEALEAREIEIGVIGNDELELSTIGEIQSGSDFYDYESKYQDGETNLIIPAMVEEETLAQLQTLAKKAYKALNCSGLSRVDCFVRTSDHKVFVNEVNTMPGFTLFSMFPLLWKHTGVEYRQLIDRLIRLGIERHQKRSQIRYRID
ncbi:D-alanine-D-alanine ligase [Pullulanibacillus pueri]|uniref:D-alanine--D-alanine ligase n=1 Tax=Pullulanibacillus pueri TaxID=1437324 RepID=A0A8J3EP78_9BACL|nr:D-alanine--D-alanine ligase [Pullulanibacillus pueri]MBM7680476.1 D-alanine-D-alanine ligase [Pullulanibacillus pueri]GGH88181.1 D-alanine--D-alanine ligase [Pullulanibacillus pueri]